MTTAIGQLIGERLRSERRARGLSVGGLADAAGIGKGSLSEIENAARSPTISTLYALAGALGVPLATLLADRVGTEIGSDGFSALLLDVRAGESGVVEVYRLSFEAGSSRRSGAHGDGVHEHLLVTAGRLRAGRTGAEVTLRAGESTTWVSDTAHGYAALGAAPAEAVLVIRSPSPTPGRAEA